MADALINAMNFFLANTQCPDLVAETMLYVEGIIVAVTGKDYNIFLEKTQNFNIQLDLGKYNGALESLRNILENEITGESINDIVHIINIILDNLNNESYNLKVGNASWNASIGSGFDPFDEVEYDGEVFLIKWEDARVLTALLHGTKGSGPNFDQSGVYFYTALLDGRPYIYQSSTVEHFVHANELKETDIPICYFDGIENRYIKIQGDE
jgi:hypothetical protein